ncbi:hypothetical protein Tco_0228268 [Tanacetum coccineum]
MWWRWWSEEGGDGVELVAVTRGYWWISGEDDDVMVVLIVVVMVDLVAVGGWSGGRRLAGSGDGAGKVERNGAQRDREENYELVVPAGSSSNVPADYVSAGHVLVPADRDTIYSISVSRNENMTSRNIISRFYLCQQEREHDQQKHNQQERYLNYQQERLNAISRSEHL